jgi:hypothetical protein
MPSFIEWFKQRKQQKSQAKKRIQNLKNAFQDFAQRMERQPLIHEVDILGLTEEGVLNTQKMNNNNSIFLKKKSKIHIPNNHLLGFNHTQKFLIPNEAVQFHPILNIKYDEKTDFLCVGKGGGMKIGYFTKLDLIRNKLFSKTDGLYLHNKMPKEIEIKRFLLQSGQKIPLYLGLDQHFFFYCIAIQDLTAIQSIIYKN